MPIVVPRIIKHLSAGMDKQATSLTSWTLQPTFRDIEVSRRYYTRMLVSVDSGILGVRASFGARNADDIQIGRDWLLIGPQFGETCK
jgi:hypothetical protein